jgi:hypothetical protein
MDDPTIPEADKQPISIPDSFDPYVNVELSLPMEQNSTMEFSCVLQRKKDNDGNSIGITNDNLNLESRMYVVEWSDERTEDFYWQISLQKLIFSSENDEGNRYALLDDHQNTEGNISGNNCFITLNNGMK